MSLIHAAAVLDAIAKTAPGLGGVTGKADPKAKSRAFNSAKVSAHHAIIPTEATAHFSIADYHAYRAPQYDTTARPAAAPAASASTSPSAEAA